jgi:hypothetical protein
MKILLRFIKNYTKTGRKRKCNSELLQQTMQWPENWNIEQQRQWTMVSAKKRDANWKINTKRNSFHWKNQHAKSTRQQLNNVSCKQHSNAILIFEFFNACTFSFSFKFRNMYPYLWVHRYDIVLQMSCSDTSNNFLIVGENESHRFKRKYTQMLKHTIALISQWNNRGCTKSIKIMRH